MTTHRHHRFAFATPCLTMLLLGALACGGGDKKGADEPAGGDEEEVAAEPKSADDGMFPPEKFDEIQRFFDRKRNYMTRCFTEAIDAGEVDKRTTAGRATVVMTINKRGQPTKVRISQMQPKSAYLEKCIIENVEKWTITTLPKPLDYSYTFGFGTL